MAKYISNRQQNLKIGIVSYTEDKTVLQVTGNVGIKTADTQGYELYVNGDANISDNVTAQNYYGYGANLTGISTFANVNITNGTFSNIYVSGISTLGTVKISSGIISATVGVVTYYGDGSNLQGVNAFNVINQDINSTPVFPTFASNTGVSSVGISTTKLVFIPASGNLGLGTTNPQAKLDVVGDIKISGVSTLGAVTISSGIITAVGLGTVVYYGDGSNLQGVNAFNVINQDINSTPVFPTFASNTGVSSVGISTTKLVFIPASGNLGLGTTNPQAKLDVVGDGLFTGVVTATTFIGALTGTATTATNLKNGLAGNVVYQSAPDTTTFLANGIGGYVLQSNGTGNAPTWVAAAPAGAVTGLIIRDFNNSIVGTSGSVTQLTFSAGLSVTGTTGAAGIATITLSSNIVGTSLSITGISTFTNGPVLVGSGTSTGTASQPLQVTGGAYVSGSVGIGTTSPQYTLDVGGDINTSTDVKIDGISILTTSNNDAVLLAIALG